MSDSLMIASIRARLWRQNKNWLAVLCGGTGSGKSWSAISLASKIDSNFSIDNVLFTPKEFIKAVNSGRMVKGSAWVYDEGGITFGAREWMTKYNKNLSYILQSFRHMNSALIITVPSIDLIDTHFRRLAHNYLETHRIDYEKRICRIRWFFLQWNPLKGKLYQKYPRMRLPDGKIQRVDFVDVGAPDDMLIKEYEARKKQYLGQLNREIEQRLFAEEKPKRISKKPAVLRELKRGKHRADIAAEVGVTLRYVDQIASVLLREKHKGAHSS